MKARVSGRAKSHQFSPSDQHNKIWIHTDERASLWHSLCFTRLLQWSQVGETPSLTHLMDRRAKMQGGNTGDRNSRSTDMNKVRTTSCPRALQTFLPQMRTTAYDLARCLAISRSRALSVRRTVLLLDSWNLVAKGVGHAEFAHCDRPVSLESRIIPQNGRRLFQTGNCDCCFNVALKKMSMV
jgi:hypothetical protein